MERQIKKPVYQNQTIVPEASFALPKHVANATSNNPAIISKIQFIILGNGLLVMGKSKVQPKISF
jgi:hypothetical protein